MYRVTRNRLWRVVMTMILTTSLTMGLTAAPSAAAVVTHQVTNIGDKSFTVTWFSAAAEVGQVNWGTAEETLDQTAYDDRGEATSDDTHHVTVSGLTAGNTYYFEIVSGGATCDDGGSPFSVTTGPTLGFVLPMTLITGTVYLSDGVTAAEGAIVYLQITGTGGGDSQVFSKLTDASGDWTMPIDALRNADLQAYSPDIDDDQMLLSAQGAADGSDSQVTTVGTAKAAAPNMVLSLGPTVTDTVPASDATDVAVDADIVVTFSTNMDETATEAAFSIDPVVAGTRTLVDDTLTFNPTADLATDTVYTVTIADTAEDTGDKPMTAPHVFSFSTEDTIAPPDPAD
ncbi:MAG TPA: hypothetical protein G4O07_09245, partial [Dehalococcoidia bacterium]|nr:hypothetical protein [Dehalococcoidia bacterium]